MAILAAGLGQVVERYAHFGPLLAAFLANFFATFGDKGQLVILTLATQYDAKRVFAGAMSAFAAWSAVEVLVGTYVVQAVPAGAISLVTGTLFVAFGAWTVYEVWAAVRDGDAATDGGSAAPSVLPNRLLSVVGTRGGVVTAFVFILFAEFGDKTQLLTINLAATFPDSLVTVYVGVVVALGLRTAIDAFVGERAERYLPTLHMQAASAVVFLAFGLAEFGVVGDLSLVVAVVAAVAFCVGAGVERRTG